MFTIEKPLYPTRDDFLEEANILGRLNDAWNMHLAILSATFEVGSEAAPAFYFIFPRADSNLRAF